MSGLRRGAMPQAGQWVNAAPYVCPPDKASSRPSRQNSGHHKHALAARLLIENPIRLLRLVQPPAVAEQVVDRKFSLCDEGCAFGLPDLRKGPRADNGELLAQQIAADIQGHAAALADKANRSPRPCRPNRDHPA